MNTHKALILMKMLLINSLFFIMVGCNTNIERNTKKIGYKSIDTITQSDSVYILSRILNSPEVFNSIVRYNPTKSLKIVRNDILKNDYQFEVSGKKVVYVDFDSSATKLTIWNKPVYYAVIKQFKVEGNRGRGEILFNSYGQYIEFEFIKNKKPVLTEISISQF